MGTGDFVTMMEAAYRLELDERAWLRGLVSAAEPLIDRGFGVGAYVYEVTGDAFPVTGTMELSSRFDPSWLGAFRDARPPRERNANEQEAPESWRQWLHMPCGTASGVPGLEALCAALTAFGGARDVFVVNGTDPTMFGVWIGSPLPHLTQVTPRSRRLYTRIATHLAASYRLRRNLARAGETLATSDGEAVLSPDGSVLHAQGGARASDAREALRQAALRIERARTRAGRSDEEGATQSWQGMVQARWSLVERERNGEPRQLVARRNETANEGLGVLSRRELQVLGFAALGREDRDIAYDLGLTAATVRVVLHRAGRKLACSGRVALLRRFAELRTVQP